MCCCVCIAGKRRSRVAWIYTWYCSTKSCESWDCRTLGGLGLSFVNILIHHINSPLLMLLFNGGISYLFTFNQFSHGLLDVTTRIFGFHNSDICTEKYYCIYHPPIKRCINSLPYCGLDDWFTCEIRNKLKKFTFVVYFSYSMLGLEHCSFFFLPFFVFGKEYENRGHKSSSARHWTMPGQTDYWLFVSFQIEELINFLLFL